jgi:hypothetical protein
MSEGAAPLDDLLLVRSTVHLRGLPVGDEAWVDPRHPSIAVLLQASFLVPVARAQSAPDLTATMPAVETLAFDPGDVLDG